MGGSYDVNRYLVLSVSVFVSCLCSANYAFGVWSNVLKTDPRFNYSQEQVEVVSLAGNLGMYGTFFAGVLYDAKGPAATLLMGLCLGVSGWLLLYLSLQGTIDASEYQLALMYALGSNAQGFFDTAALCTNIHHFPASRGLIIGLGKAFNGLGAGIFASVYSGFFSAVDHPAGPGHIGPILSFMLFLVVLQAVVPLVGSVLIVRMSNPPHANVQQPGEAVRIKCGYALTSTLAATILATALVQDLTTVHNTTTIAFTVVVLVLASLFLLFPVGTGRLCTPRSYDLLGTGTGTGTGTEAEPLDPTRPACQDPAEVPSAPAADYTPRQVVSGLRFYLLFSVVLVVSGSGLTVINNIAQLSLALDPAHASSGHVFVSIMATANCVGRLSAGVVVDKLRLGGRDVTWAVACNTLLMLLAQLYLRLATFNMLYVGVFLAAFSFGALWTLIPATLGSYYGTKHLGTVYNIFNFAPMLGSYVIASKLPGSLYDREVAKQGGGNTCAGPDCFGPAFLINVGLCGIALICACGLLVRRPGAYSHTHGIDSRLRSD